MRVRITALISGPGPDGVMAPGEVYDLDRGAALDLVHRGCATWLPDEQPEVVKVLTTRDAAPLAKRGGKK